MRFISQEHQAFYEQAKPEDAYHRALFYLIGLCPDTRRNARALYGKDGIKPEAIHAGWQTGTSAKVTRLAFNLFTDGVPTAYSYASGNERSATMDDGLRECQLYSASDIFCCEYAPYFMEAIKLRYPEYCRDVPDRGVGRDDATGRRPSVLETLRQYQDVIATHDKARLRHPPNGRSNHER